MVTKSTLKRLNDFFRNVKLLQTVTESGLWDVCTSKTQNVVSRVFLAFLFLTIEMHIFFKHMYIHIYIYIYIRTDTITDKENAIMKRKEKKRKQIGRKRKPSVSFKFWPSFSLALSRF